MKCVAYNYTHNLLPEYMYWWKILSVNNAYFIRESVFKSLSKNLSFIISSNYLWSDTQTFSDDFSFVFYVFTLFNDQDWSCATGA